MIFCIGDEIINSICNNEQNFPQDLLLYQLNSIVNSNYNILTVESDLIVKKYTEVKDSSVIDNILKKILFRCFKEYSQVFGLTKIVVTKIIITLSEDIILTSDMKISLNYLCKHELLLGNRVNLLSEDNSDAEFYHNIAQYIYKDRAPGTTVQFRHSAAAGNNLGSTLEKNVMENGDFVLSICDSDINVPGNDVGVTANSLCKAKNKLRDENVYHFECWVLEVHEKENLITPKEYGKFLTDNNNYEYFIFFEDSSEHFDYLLYYDYKFGIKKSNMNSLYNMDFINLFPHFLNGKVIEELQPKESITVNLGRKCLSNFRPEFLNDNTDNKIEKYRKAIALIVWSWGLSYRSKLII